MLVCSFVWFGRSSRVIRFRFFFSFRGLRFRLWLLAGHSGVPFLSLFSNSNDLPGGKRSLSFVDRCCCSGAFPGGTLNSCCVFLDGALRTVTRVRVGDHQPYVRRPMIAHLHKKTCTRRPARRHRAPRLHRFHHPPGAFFPGSGAAAFLPLSRSLFSPLTAQS